MVVEGVTEVAQTAMIVPMFSAYRYSKPELGQKALVKARVRLKLPRIWARGRSVSIHQGPTTLPPHPASPDPAKSTASFWHLAHADHPPKPSLSQTFYDAGTPTTIMDMPFPFAEEAFTKLHAVGEICGVTG
jgi:hypothetical protein